MSTIARQNFYQRLRCSESASYEEIRKNFQMLALRYHPDKQLAIDKSDLSALCGETLEDTSNEFHLIIEAWDILKDKDKRKVYDSLLMRQKCDPLSPIFSYLSWHELDWDGNIYSYMCRCGDMYIVDSKERTANKVIRAQCNGCSLEIIVDDKVS